MEFEHIRERKFGLRIVDKVVGVLLLGLLVLVLVNWAFELKARAAEPVDEVTFDPGITISRNTIAGFGEITFDAEPLPAAGEDESDPATWEATTGFVAMDGENPSARWEDEFKFEGEGEAPAEQMAEANIAGLPVAYLLATLAAVLLSVVVLLIARWLDRRQQNRIVRPPGVPRVCSDIAQHDPPVEPHAVGGGVDPRLIEHMAQAAERRRANAWASKPPILLTKEMKKGRPAPPNGGVN